MYYVVWQYEVAKHNQQEFEKEYGEGGIWHKLFSTSAHYKGSHLSKGVDHSNVYTLIDQWNSKEQYKLFLSVNKERYESLSTVTATCYTHEKHIGEMGE